MTDEELMTFLKQAERGFECFRSLWQSRGLGGSGAMMEYCRENGLVGWHALPPIEVGDPKGLVRLTEAGKEKLAEIRRIEG